MGHDAFATETLDAGPGSLTLTEATSNLCWAKATLEARRTKMNVRTWTLLFCFSIPGWSQRPQFEVASVKPAEPAPTKGIRSVGGARSADPGLFVCDDCTLSDMVRSAFDIRSFQISGPAWMDGDRFTVTAKVPSGTTGEQLRLMQQALLEERFGLQFHRDQKEMLRYELVVAKSGAKLKAHGGDANDGGATMRTTSSRALGEHVHGRSSGDSVQTGAADGDECNGTNGHLRCQLVLDYGGLDVAGPSIFDALPEQLGLKLEQHKGPVDRVVIDHLEKRPSGN